MHLRKSYSMVNWKNLIKNPPIEDCNICMKVGKNYETYRFVWLSRVCWQLEKLNPIEMTKIPEEALYINLDEIL